VVGGSNPLTPTIQISHETNSYVKPPDNALSNFGNSLATIWQQFGNNPCTNQLAVITALQSALALPDSAMAVKLGISRAYFCRLKSGQRPPGRHILQKIENFLQNSSIYGNSGSLFCALYSMDAKMSGCNAQELAAAVDDFLTARQVEGKTTATLNFYRENLGRFLWWVKTRHLDCCIDTITAPLIRAFFLYLQTEGNRWRVGSNSSRKPAGMATIDAYWRTLNAFFNWNVKEGKMEQENNPMRNIPRPKVPQKIIQDIPIGLIKQALEKWGGNTFLDRRNTAIILFLWDSGARLNECYGMHIEHLDLENGTVRLWGKGGKERMSGLSEKSCLALKKYLEHLSYRKGPLWISVNGNRFSRDGIQTMIRRLRVLGGGVRWSPHTFRITFAVDFMRNGGDVFSLQTLGGWTDLEMPRHYTRALKIEDALRVHRRASPVDMLDSKAGSEH